MGKLFKRFLSMVLAIALVLCGLPSTVLAEKSEVPDLPTATVTEVEKEGLTFALNFKADEVTDEQLQYYGNWYADFELKVNKDVTFNANGGGDGHLAGQYDEAGPDWINVPFENVTLEADKTLKIMEYAAELMGEPGLKYKYGEIYEVVKDFNCGVFFEEAFLAANPDLEVTLELRMYNPADETESYVIGKTYTFPEVVELPTATVTEIEKEGLTFALNFKADDVTDAQLAYYGNWYADFELKVNKDVTFNANGGADGHLAGQYDEAGPDWVDVPFENVTLEANETLKIMEYAAELMGEPGLKYKYGEIYEVVKNFNCGVFFEEEFLAANPDFEVTLELRMYNPADETESYVIGKTYTFPDAPELPTATVTEVEKEDLTFALNFKADEVTEEQLAYYGNWYADFELKVNKDVTFNANGGADGHLAGQYDEAGPDWINVPFEDVTLEAGKVLKIMEYAAELMGEPGLKYKYGEIYDVVKDFNCGVFFEEEFLAANPDLEVTLELKMYNPADESESYVIGKTYTFPKAPELPTATVTEIKNDNLTFAMNFEADEVTEEQLAYYGNWFADFELKVNKDVTFNANGGADGFLSGQYDEWSKNWVNVPFEDVTLEANKALKIMEYAAELMGEPGLKYTYKEVYEVVKNFDCGVFFEETFLEENPDIEVTLELRMYNPEDESENYVIGETYVFTLDNMVPEVPTATVKELDKENLTFAMNFEADEVTEEQLDYYGNWFADFELKINKDVTFNANGGADGFLSGQYDEWSENWVNVPFDDVTLEANETLKIMEYAAELMGEPGLKYTYKEVYEVVKNFDCGVAFTPEFIKANPDLEVTLELRMYNPKNEDVSYVIGETYVFTLEDAVAVNMRTGKVYDEVMDGLLEAVDSDTVALLKNVDTSMVVVPEAIIFDLEGYKLTTDYMSVFGNIIDDSKDNTGLLVVPKNHFLIQPSNKQLPVFNGKGYMFFEVIGFNSAVLEENTYYAFQPLFEEAAHEVLLKGGDVTGVTINVEVSWKQNDGVRTQNFVYKDEFVKAVVESYNSTIGKYDEMFFLKLRGGENLDGLTYNAVVKATKDVKFSAQ